MTVWTPTDDGYADLTSHDTFLRGAPHNTFARLRLEDPMHWTDYDQGLGFWSVTRYNDIMAVDTNHGVFSSEAALGGITIRDARPDLRRPSFIAMDPPRHDEQRKAVSPIVSPANLKTMEPIIRERACRILASV